MRALIRCDRCWGDSRIQTPDGPVQCPECRHGRVEVREATDELILAAGEKFGTRRVEEMLEWMDEHRGLVMAWLAEVGWVVQSQWGLIRVPGSKPTVPSWSEKFYMPSFRVVSMDSEPDAVALFIARGVDQ